MNFAWDLLPPWQRALLLAIPPAVVLLYFLKLRREPLEVPSTYLWSRTVEDMHVNSIWQKLRRNLLLFLQLLLLFLVILACMNPNWRGSKLEDDRAIFLIDNSASSNATDMGKSRLDIAKEQVKSLIESEMKSGDKGMIIAFSDADGARTIQSYTDNKRVLLRKLETIQPTHRRTDLRQALRFASGLANPGRSNFGDDTDVAAAQAKPAALFILTDGRVAQSPRFSIGNLKPTYIKLGTKEAQNVAITAFQATRNPEKPDFLQVFAGLENFGSQPQQIELELYHDGKLIDASSLDLAAGAEGGREFLLTSLDAGTLRILAKVDDDLAVDNEAFAVLDPGQRAKVLIVTQGNPFLTGAFSTDRMSQYVELKTTTPDYLQGEEYEKEAVAGTYDLVIFDQCAPERPERMPLSHTVFFGAIPPSDETMEASAQWQGEESVAGPAIIDVDQSHPVMQFVNMENVLVGEATPLQPPAGATSLIDTDVGSIAAISTRESVQDLVVGFALLGRGEDGSEYYNTTWVRNDPSYPVFIQNLAKHLAGVAENAEATIYRPGQLVQIRVESNSKTLTMTTPDGKEVEVGRGRTGAFAFSNADKIGIYELRDEANADEEAATYRVALNLFDDVESDIVPVDELALDEEHAISGESRGVERTRRDTWKWIALLALAVLATEWYIYNRRVYL